jgi:RimJ/RimL family protein N-acetyltransferase
VSQRLFDGVHVTKSTGSAAPTIQGKDIVLRPMEVSDAEFVLSLRLDPERNRHLNRTNPSVQSQQEWLAKYKERERAGEEYYFRIEDGHGQPFGAVRMYDFQGDSFCWGSWLIKPDAPAPLSIKSALHIYEFAFYALNFRQSHFDVRLDNEKVIAFHKRFGAKIVRSTEQDHFFVLLKSDYEAARSRYARYL